LAEFLTSNPPAIYFMDGSEVMGAYLLEVNSDIPHFFDPSTIIAFDWQQTDITAESKWRHGQKRSDSVQVSAAE